MIIYKTSIKQSYVSGIFKGKIYVRYYTYIVSYIYRYIHTHMCIYTHLHMLLFPTNAWSDRYVISIHTKNSYKSVKKKKITQKQSAKRHKL